MSQRSALRQEAILHFLEACARREGRIPTIREIGLAARLKSPSNVVYYLDKLVEQGLIERDPNTARGIRLLRQPGIPILGEIAAGEPLALFQPGEQMCLDVAVHLRDPHEQFALRVHGDSMIDERIFDGDYVLVRPAHTDIRNGDIVVAVQLTGNGDLGAATIKRFYSESEQKRVRLQPANPTMDPIYIKQRDWTREWQVHGIVTAVYRSLGPASEGLR